jgi:hypothetical protein
MIINIGNEEHDLDEFISEVGFDIVKLDAVIAGLEEFRDRKLDTLDWLKETRSKEAELKN